MTATTAVATVTSTRTDRQRARGERLLAAERLRAPTRASNAARNARAEPGRRARWAPARDAMWSILDARIAPGARVAVVGAGNADDLPLHRTAERAGALVLVDIDPHAARAARRRLPRSLRRRTDVVECDVTGGSADAIARAAAHGRSPAPPPVTEAPLPLAPFDLVIGDLVYSQLLLPALIDLRVDEARRREVLRDHAPTLTRAVVARLHASAPQGAVLHVHDPVAWWPGHPQPFTLADVLAVAGDSVDRALHLVARGTGPFESDPRRALAELGIPILESALWCWPFSHGVSYLACGTLAG